MRPNGLRTRIFLDGGDPGETRALLAQLGFLDGQTTNPTLISKNPAAQKRLVGGDKFAAAEVLGFYRNVVTELSGLLPKGSVSIEVYADSVTMAEAMLRQGREMFSWIPNAHIKFPQRREGLKAAQAAVTEGLRVNMTLCFSQEQAAAVYVATQGREEGTGLRFALHRPAGRPRRERHGPRCQHPADVRFRGRPCGGTDRERPEPGPLSLCPCPGIGHHHGPGRCARSLGQAGYASSGTRILLSGKGA